MMVALELEVFAQPSVEPVATPPVTGFVILQV